MAGNAEQASVGPGKVGRYFTVVSFLPSAVLVAYVVFLIRTGAWTGPVNLSAVAVGFDLGSVALVGIASLLVALTLNPLQFALIQLFEGYWGVTKLGHDLQLLRLRHHRRRKAWLERQHKHADRGLERYGGVEDASAPDEALALSITANETDRLIGYYPKKFEDVLPTRLGNVLRRYERNVGSTYGLDLILSAPRLAMVGQQREVDYVQNQRVQLELAVRTSFLSLVAVAVTVAFMWRHGFWLLLALGPYLVAYLSYRGAVVLAHEYGTALAVLLELNRFTLYEKLHHPVPDRPLVEVRQNEKLMEAFRYEPKVDLRYEHPVTTTADTAATPPPDNDETP